MTVPDVLDMLAFGVIVGVTVLVGYKGLRLVTIDLRRAAQRARTREFVAEVRAHQHALPPATGSGHDENPSPDPLAGLTVVSRSDVKHPRPSDRDAFNLVDFHEFVHMTDCTGTPK